MINSHTLLTEDDSVGLGEVTSESCHVLPQGAAAPPPDSQKSDSSRPTITLIGEVYLGYVITNSK